MKKTYNKPNVLSNMPFPGIPTVIAVALVSAAAGAAAVGVSKLVGDDYTRNISKNFFLMDINNAEELAI